MSDTASPPRVIRVLINGCWDLLHTGHYNAIRQVAKIADAIQEEHLKLDEIVKVEVVAGIHPNTEIRKAKGGEFVCSEAEKETMLLACKWVDSVIHDVPYGQIEAAFLDKHKIDYCVHGDDAVHTPDGTDMYGVAKSQGRYREFRRSECISTTTLINRILGKYSGSNANEGFSLTSRRMTEFAKDMPPIELAQKIVYICGVWDLLHAGHVQALQQAMDAVPDSDYLLVGVHHDTSTDGRDRTITSDGERALSLLSCRHVSDVVLQAPRNPSADFFRAFNISAVIVVKNHPDFDSDPARFAEAEGVSEVVEISLPVGTASTDELINRVLDKRDKFEARNAKKVDPGVSAVTCNTQLRA